MLTAEQEIAAALERGDRGAIHYWETVIRVADSAPPFTPELASQLEVLLRPGLPATLPPRPAPPALPDRMPPRPAPVKRRPVARSTARTARDDEAAPPVGTRSAA